MKTKELIEATDEIETAVRSASSMIFHSTPMTSYKEGSQLDLRDILGVISPVTGRHCLLNGSSGLAKTHLALLCLAGVYGSEGYGQLQIDPSLELDKLFNIDGEKLRNGKLSDAILPTKLITAPGVLLDEVNRAHATQNNNLQAYLNNQALTPSGGISRQCGIKVEGNGWYQLKFGTCNEGKWFAEGTFKMDEAFRRRWPIEIPTNLFMPTESDRWERSMAGRTATGLYVPPSQGVIDKVIGVYSSFGSIGMHPFAREFILYLGRMNNCIKSPFKTKDEAGFNVERCAGCHAIGTAGEQNFCGNVYAPPPATQGDLEAVARGFALVRAHHKAAETGIIPESIEVMPEDMYQAFPFVAATKMRFDPAWLEKHFKSGEPFEAAKAIGINLEQRIAKKLRALGKLCLQREYTKDEMQRMLTYS